MDIAKDGIVGQNSLEIWELPKCQCGSQEPADYCTYQSDCAGNEFLAETSAKENEAPLYIEYAPIYIGNRVLCQCENSEDSSYCQSVGCHAKWLAEQQAASQNYCSCGCGGGDGYCNFEPFRNAGYYVP